MVVGFICEKTREVVYFSMEETLIYPVDIWPEESTRKLELTVRRVMEENLVPLKMALDSETMASYQRNWSCDTYCSVSDSCFMELKKEILAARWAQRIKQGEKKNGQPRSTKKKPPSRPFGLNSQLKTSLPGPKRSSKLRQRRCGRTFTMGSSPAAGSRPFGNPVPKSSARGSGWPLSLPPRQART